MEDMEVLIEGRTEHRLPPVKTDRTDLQMERHGKGPADRSHRGPFHNPAMEGCRTRSVLLMDYILDTPWFKNSEIHVLDALCATGSRINRWLTELPPDKVKRLKISGADLDDEALEWAQLNCPGVDFHNMDSRQLLLSSGWQWVDIDPFGSPLPFLDAAMQSSARKAVMEITATDSAALTGSSASACLRRYEARIRTDEIAHDSALRLLMATVARTASRHDRMIHPLLSSWDSHHIRVSVKVIRSIEGANEVEGNLGWRVAKPTAEELTASVEAGLHSNGSTPGQPFCLLPLSHPVARTDKRISGPLWVGPLFDSEVLAAMTEEKAIEMCATEEAASIKKAARSVKHWAGESELANSQSLIITDMLPQCCKIKGPPALEELIAHLKKAGHQAAIARWADPAIRTNASWSEVIQLVESEFDYPPM